MEFTECNVRFTCAMCTTIEQHRGNYYTKKQKINRNVFGTFSLQQHACMPTSEAVHIVFSRCSSYVNLFEVKGFPRSAMPPAVAITDYIYTGITMILNTELIPHDKQSTEHNGYG